MGQNGGRRPGAGRKKGSKLPRTLAREAGRTRALAKEAMTAEETMRLIAWQARSDLGALFDDHGNLAPVKSLPLHVRATLASAKTLKTNVVSGDGQQEVTREVRLWDKLRALELLAKHFGLITEKHDVTHHLDELLERLDRGRQRTSESKKSLTKMR